MGYKDWLLKGYYDYRAYVPSRCLYHWDFFRVTRLLTAGAEAIAAESERRLRNVLNVAVRFVPFYKNRVKLTAAELNNEPTIDLLQRFPYVSKAQVMDCQRDFLDERIDPRKLLYATSEGSSGQGIGVWRTKRLTDIEKAFYTHEWGKLGFTFDKARYLRMGADAIRGHAEPSVTLNGNRILLSPHHITACNKAAIVSALNRFRPQFVHAYPSAAAALSEFLQAGDLDFETRGVLLASEAATPAQLASIARLFRCPISMSYGLTERTNLAFASWNNGSRGPFEFQSLYGVNENRRNDGCDEIVGTSCWNDLMPLIRYCTDDFGTIDEFGCCPAITGRGQEFLLDCNGNRIPGLWMVVDAVIWNYVRLIQIRQRKPGEITISVVAQNGSLKPEHRKIVLDAQLKRWGGIFKIGLVEVADIPLASNGKRQFVINELHVGH